MSSMSSPTEMSQLTIDQLPDLCLRKIFALLSLPDLVKCRAVTKQFKYYADRTRVTELVVNYRRGDEDRDNWYLTNRSIEGSISPRAFHSLQTSQPQLCERLKFLWIHSLGEAGSKFLNGCSQLIHLEFNWLHNRYNSPFECTLPNLKVLSAGYQSYPGLVLKTAKLEVLKCNELERIKFEHPETIKKLECDYPDWIAQFKNLEVLTIVRCQAIYRVLDRIPPTVWEHLKELDLRLDWSRLGSDSYEALRRSLTNLLSTRASLESGLKIYLGDVRLLDAGQLKGYDFMRRPFDFYLRNWKLITAGHRFGVTRVNYNDLIHLFSDLTSDFFEKFPSIRAVEVTGLADHDQLAWFLKNTNNLRELIVSSTIGQEFLNNLPNINDRLTDLKINENHPNTVTNFDFVLQFRSLRSFVTNLQGERALDLAAKLFHQIANFHEFWSKLPSSEIIVIRRDRSVEDGFKVWFLKTKNCTSTLKSDRATRRWSDLVEICEKRKISDPPTRSRKRMISDLPTRSSKRIKREK